MYSLVPGRHQQKQSILRSLPQGIVALAPGEPSADQNRGSVSAIPSSETPFFLLPRSGREPRHLGAILLGDVVLVAQGGYFPPGHSPLLRGEAPSAVALKAAPHPRR